MMKKTDTGVELSGTVVMTAKVQAMNERERLVVLADADGNVQVVEAGPEVKNFDQIAIGDTVTAEFYKPIALQIAEPIDTKCIVVMTAPKGAKPGMIAKSIRCLLPEQVNVQIADAVLRNGSK